MNLSISFGYDVVAVLKIVREAMQVYYCKSGLLQHFLRFFFAPHCAQTVAIYKFAPKNFRAWLYIKKPGSYKS